MFNFRPKIPWLHVPSEPLENALPGFRVRPETPQRPWWDAFGSTTDAYSPDIGVPVPAQTSVDGTLGHIGSEGSGPEDFFNWYVQPTAPVVPTEVDPNPPSGTWPMSVEMTEPQSPPAEGGAELPLEFPAAGFRVESPDDSRRYPIPAYDWRREPLPENVRGGTYESGTGPIIGNQPARSVLGTGSYASSLPIYDPVYLPELPPDRVQQALDEISRIYGLNRFQPTGLSNRPTSGIKINPAADESHDDYPPVNGLDPRYILPANVGRQPPPTHPRNPGAQKAPTSEPQKPQLNQRQQPTEKYPGNTHNNPPEPISASKPVPPRPTPHVHTPQQIIGHPADLTGAAVVAELLAPKPELDKHIERIRPAARVREEEAANNQSVPPGGFLTKTGVQMHPDAPPPAVDELSVHEHLNNGARGEQQLVNRIIMTVPGERVLHYGNAAGQQGADIISVSPDGIISVWDSKWRSGPRPMSAGGRAHQTDLALGRLCDQVKDEIAKAVKSGRLPLHVAAKAMENATARNFFINTVGTGGAHRGVSQYIGGCKAGEFRRF